MTGPGPQEQRASIEQVLSELEARRPIFESLCKELCAHIEKCLRDEQIVFQAVQSRVKSAAKVEAKYLAPHKASRYERLEDLTDIAAIRIVTYYEDKVDAIKSILEREFQIDWENSHDKRVPDNPELFTYSALHLVVSLKPETLGARAHKQFAGMRAEIQITTSLRHAWAEIEHKWYDLWDAFPVKAKRRFARLSALIEMADQEFVSLRKEFEAGNESAGVLVGSDENTPIDAQSLRAFIEMEPLVQEIDHRIAQIVNATVTPTIADTSIFFSRGGLILAELSSIKSLRESLLKNRTQVIDLASAYIRPGSQIDRGESVNLLTMLLTSRKIFSATGKYLS